MSGSDPMQAACFRFRSWPANRRRRLARVAVLLLCAGCMVAFAWPQAEPPQNPPPESSSQDQPRPDEPGNAAADAPAPTPLPSNAARAVVHGMVKNAATGEPLARALVRVEGDAATGALTDGNGHFEISNVPVGPEAFQVIKPGFMDTAEGEGGPPTVVNGNSNSEHNVQVVSDMADLVFTLAPTNAIHGKVELSTGDPGQNLAVLLLRRVVQDGRAVWQPVTNARTNSEGAYRFAGLTDGTYAVYTEPAMDSEVPAAFVEPGSDQAVMRAGYPSVFYPDARDLAGAGRIQVAGGQQAQANLVLSEEPFRMVRASLTLPGGADLPTGTPLNVSVSVLDAQGHQLPYSGQYDAATRSAQAFLPDGTYVLQATALNIPRVMRLEVRSPVGLSSDREDVTHGGEGPLIGQAEFSIAGHAVTHLQIPLAAERSNTVQISLLRSGAAQQGAASNAQPLVIMVSQAGGWISDGLVTAYAEGYATGPIDTSSNMGPGAYWVHTSIPQKTLCEGSFTAGGASLAREPLLLSLTGASAPLTLTLRDDCASLKLSLPPNAEVSEAGDERYYTAYVVPDFDSTVDITPVVLRPSSGGTFTIDGLTPGSYHVYTFAHPVDLEYRNPEAMAALNHPAQTITLAPGGSSSLVVEVPGN
jgi:hypothetical protein